MAMNAVSGFARLGSNNMYLLSYKAPRSNRWSETSRRVQRRSRVVDTCKLSHEQCQTDSNGRDEGVLGFLSGQHQNDEDQKCSQKHLDEYTLGDGDSWRQCRVHRGNGSWKHARDKTSGGHCTQDLSWEL